MNAFPTAFTSFNPSTGESVWEGHCASSKNVDTAVASANSAFLKWSMESLDRRIDYVESYATILQQRAEELARLIAREIGKPLWEARTEVAAMVGKVAISISAYRDRCGDREAGPSRTRFRPHGAVAVIGPYNFPGHLPNGHIVPALLAGNTILFKPSEKAPAVAEAMAACWEEAGLPHGVLQVLQGKGSTAQALIGNPGVAGVFFTGSAHTGKRIAHALAEQPGRILALEMGGNNPLIVDTDYLENLSAAVTIALHSAFLSAGQRCTCARRLILLEGAQTDPFLHALIEAASALVIGDPFSEPQPFMGPLADAAFPEAVLRAQKERLQAGGEPLLKARALNEETGFITPGIVDMTALSSLPDEEVFGPFLQITRVKDLDTAIRAANATRFGLASGVLTDSAERYLYCYPRLRAGLINWNAPLTGASSAAPFGGIGDSGNHRPSAYFAADYCAYPVASIENERCQPPAPLPPASS